VSEYYAGRQRKNPGGTAFTNWLPKQRGLEAVEAGFVGTDVDMVWYNYKSAQIMLLEEKKGQEEYRISQRTTLAVLNQALSFAFAHPDFILSTPKDCLSIPAKIRFYGVHVVRFENTSPDDGKIYVDGKPMTKDQFLYFLKFGKNRDEELAEIRALLEDISHKLELQSLWDADSTIRECNGEQDYLDDFGVA